MTNWATLSQKERKKPAGGGAGFYSQHLSWKPALNCRVSSRKKKKKKIYLLTDLCGVGGVRDWTQGPMQARQALYQLSHTQISFSWVCYDCLAMREVLLCSPDWPRTCSLYALVICHVAQLKVLIIRKSCSSVVEYCCLDWDKYLWKTGAKPKKCSVSNLPFCFPTASSKHTLQYTTPTCVKSCSLTWSLSSEQFSGSSSCA